MNWDDFTWGFISGLFWGVLIVPWVYRVTTRLLQRNDGQGATDGDG